MFLIFAAWTAFGLGLAVLFRGTALAIGLGLAYALVIDRLIAAFSGISDIVKTVSQGLLGTNANALVDPFRASAIGEGTAAGAIAGPVQAAIVLGAYIDRKGRRAGLLLTLALMSVGTLSVACVPGYNRIGVLAPVLAR